MWPTLLFLGYIYSSMASVEANSQNTQTLSNRYIVEFHDSEKTLYKRIVDSVLDATIHHHYDSPVFSGVSIESKTLSLEHLKDHPGVKSVWRTSTIQLNTRDVVPPSRLWNPHISTGVQELHDRGYLGAGIVVGVIDTGIDGSNPAIAGRLISAVDFTEEGKDPDFTNKDFIGHGTKCATVVAGNMYPFIGSAPAAKLRSYKIVDSKSSSPEDTMIAAVIAAMNDKVDILSVSQALIGPFPDLPIAQVFERAAKGIIVVTGAGNGGRRGAYAYNSLGTGPSVIAVGSSTAIQTVEYNATFVSSSGASFPINFVSMYGGSKLPVGTFDIDFVTDACNIPEIEGDKNQTFLVGPSSNCQIADLYSSVTDRGYNGTIIFQNSTSLSYLIKPLDVETQIKYAFTSDTSGFLEWISKNIATGQSIKVLFAGNQTAEATANLKPVAGLMSQYSSWGPTYSQGFGPHIVAPGGSVLLNGPNNSVLVQLGTSFSTPYISGVAAIYLAAHPGTKPLEFRNKLLGCSRMLPLADVKRRYAGDQDGELRSIEPSTYAPLIQQGTGFINAVGLFDQVTSIVSDPYLNLNDTQFRVSKHTVALRNSGLQQISYSVKHVGLNTVYVRSPQNLTINPLFPPMVPLRPSARISTTLFVLGPGQVGSFDVDISPPSGLDEASGPIFEGTFVITGSNNDTVAVPYIGAEFRTSDWTSWTVPPKLFRTLDDADNNINALEETFTFNPTKGEGPYVLNIKRFASTYLAFDLVDASYNISNYSYPPTVGQMGYIGELQAGDGSGPQNGISTLMYKSELFQVLKMDNDSLIADGHYRVLARSLNPFGNQTNPSDWTLYLTGDFFVSHRNLTIGSSSSTTQSSTPTGQSLGVATMTAGLSSIEFNVIRLIMVMLAVFGNVF